MKTHFIHFGLVFLFILSSFQLFPQNSMIAIGFANDQSTIFKIQKVQFDRRWEALPDLEIKSIKIYAYCDDKGSIDYNQKLSERRAQYAKSLVLGHGVADSLIIVCQGLGEVALLGSDDIEVQRTTNRRADIKIEFYPEEKDKAANTNFTNELKVRDKLTFQTILFEGGRHVLLPESYPALDQLVKGLKAYPSYHIIIHGHICCHPDTSTDGLDIDTQKKNLSTARAKMIYDFLVKEGIAAERLSYKGHGVRFPLGKGEKYDRRVEIEISKIVD